MTFRQFAFLTALCWSLWCGVPGAGATQPAAPGSPQASDAVDAASESPASISLEQIFFVVLSLALIVLVFVLAMAYVLHASEGERNSTPTHGTPPRDWRERVLDANSELAVWNAVGQGDGVALREELKLMELRAIRRQCQN